MTREQYEAFSQFRSRFRGQTAAWTEEFTSALLPLQQDAAGSSYTVETPIVYNTALDAVTQESNIALIVVGDNPGKAEQAERAYMVGMSGRLAEGFFRRNPALGIDFRQNAIILNKTPLHTAKTHLLRRLARGAQSAAELLKESCEWMARETALLHQRMDEHGGVSLWVAGYGELRPHGVFLPWRDAFCAAYASCFPSQAWQDVKVYQHFSMNRFAIDLAAWRKNHPQMSLAAALSALGEEHKRDVLGQGCAPKELPSA